MALGVFANIAITIGLICDILGVIVLTVMSGAIFRYFMKNMNTVRPKNDTEKTAMTKKEKWITVTGLSLIIGGFIIQGIGTWMPS